MSARKKTGVLISGRGSNMRALIDAAKDETYPAEIALVISNRPGAAGLETAKAEGIPAIAIDHKAFGTREAFEDEMHRVLADHDVEFVACAGFMRLMTAGFTSKWQGRMINIHPSLLPAYKGLDTHERALADGATVHGCTVHFVTPELDSGPIIIQAEVPVLPDDTPDTLAARVLEQEHIIYPKALAMVATGEAVME